MSSTHFSKLPMLSKSRCCFGTTCACAQGAGDLGAHTHTAGLGMGRSDSSGPHTLALLRSGPTLPMRSERLPGTGGEVKPAGGTTRLLADVTMASAAGSPLAGVRGAAPAAATGAAVTAARGQVGEQQMHRLGVAHRCSSCTEHCFMSGTAQPHRRD